MSMGLWAIGVPERQSRTCDRTVSLAQSFDVVPAMALILWLSSRMTTGHDWANH